MSTKTFFILLERVNSSRRKKKKASAAKKSKKLSAAEVVGGNTDLLTEILLRVPARHVIRLKLVSKRWRLLISESHFCRCHAMRNPNPGVSSIIIFPRSDPHYDVGSLMIPRVRPNRSSTSCSNNYSPRVLLRSTSSVHHLQSCNGLLLINFFFSSSEYHVFNPTTGQFFTLPPIPSHLAGFGSNETCGHTLVFDPVKSPHYKVVCARFFAGERGQDICPYQTLIYSSETNSWKSSGSPFVGHVIMRNLARGLFYNGCVHWLKCNRSLCFNLDRECLINMPRHPHRFGNAHQEDGITMSIKYFGEYDGRLHLITQCIIMDNDYRTMLRVVELRFFEMEVDYSSWILKRKVNWTRNYRDNIFFIGPLFLGNKMDYDSDYDNEGGLLLLAKGTSTGMLVVCNLRGERIHHLSCIGRYDFCTNDQWMSSFCPYIETLIPI